MLISLCVIAKDEEKTLEKCLSSVLSLVDEIILVDTGSTDKTIEIASKFTTKIFSLPWIDDFSYARNYAIGIARGEWIIFLDADEYLETNMVWLRSYLNDKKHKKDALVCAFYDSDDEVDSNDSGKCVTRIFKNSPDIRYHRSIHEYLAKNGGKLIVEDCRIVIKIFHSGYSLETMYAKKKYQRNLTMLLNELKKNPADGELNFYMADTYRIGGEWLKAIFHINIALQSRNFRTKDYQRLAHILKIILMMESGSYQNRVILKTIEEYRLLYPENPELLACKGLILIQLGYADESRKCLVASEESNRENPSIVSLFYLLLPKVKKILSEMKAN